jgi:hypothetical protein
MIVKVQEVVKYGGHNLSANGKVGLTLNANYSELVNTIQVSQMLNNDVNIKAKMPGKKAMLLGSFRVGKIEIFDDGESRLKFNGLSDYVEMDNLNSLPLKDEDIPEFKVLIEADIEEEGEIDDGDSNE